MLVLVWLIWGCALGASFETYDGSQVWKVTPRTDKELQILSSLPQSLDFWKAASSLHHSVVVQTDPQTNATFFSSISAFPQEQISLLIPDLSSLILEERQRLSGRQSTDLDWMDFYPLEVIEKWLQKMATEHSDKAELRVIGKSYEQRPIYLMKVGIPLAGAGPHKKKAILIEAGVHGRAWVSHASATYFIHQMLSNSSAFNELLELVDFYIIPVLNPDGYVYSHTTNRVWKKNRAPIRDNCIGVDVSRNFPLKDDEVNATCADPGTPCFQQYCGPKPFSELESRTLRDVVVNGTARGEAKWMAYFTLQAHGRVLLIPWASRKDRINDFAEQFKLAEKANAAIRGTYGRGYMLDEFWRQLYLAKGLAFDWFRYKGYFKYVYYFEARGVNGGYLLPPKHLIPSAREMLAAIEVIAKHVGQEPGGRSNCKHKG